MQRAHNFNAGPSALPLDVLQTAQRDFLNFNGTGMSVMELSHRSKPYEEVHFGAMERLRKLMNISDEYEILFVQGGASLQFSMIPMNFLKQGEVGNYVVTGVWADKAWKEAKKLGETHVAATVKESNFSTIPAVSDIQLSERVGYVHLTSNNTIYGTQWHQFPTFNAPTFIDMSSDIFSRPMDVNNFDIIYAGAQKNLGPSGVTVVIMKKALLAQCPDHLPTMLNYKTHADNGSLFNTPPTLAIYLLSLVLEWAERQGGLTVIEQNNTKKAAVIYEAIDAYPEFYKGHATKDARSLMNITFTLPTEELTKQFLQIAAEQQFIGLAGHRSVGGLRASTYNAVPYESCAALADLLHQFAKNNR